MPNVKLRTLTNTADPITNTAGVPLANTKVCFDLYSTTGKVTTLFDSISDELIVAKRVSAITDANGIFSIDLWPNSRGSITTVYLVTVGTYKAFQIRVEDDVTVLSLANARRATATMSPAEGSLFTTLLNRLDTAVAAYEGNIITVGASVSAAAGSAAAASGSATSSSNSANNAANSSNSASTSSANSVVAAASAGTSATAAYNSAAAALTSEGHANAARSSAAQAAAAALTSLINITNLVSGFSLTPTAVFAADALVAKGYKYAVDTRLQPLTMTLPSTAAIDDVIEIVDAYSNFNVNSLTLIGNGLHIDGSRLDTVFVISGSYIRLNYTGPLYGWKSAVTGPSVYVANNDYFKIFSTALDSSDVPTRGIGDSTFVRTTASYVPDFTGRIVKSEIGYAAFPGMRKVSNLLWYSDDVTQMSQWARGGSAWLSGKILNLSADNDCISALVSIPVGNRVCVSLTLAGNGTVCVSSVGGDGDHKVTLTSIPKRFSFSMITTGTFLLYVIKKAGNTATQVTISNAQVEDITGQSTNNPAEYVHSSSNFSVTKWFETANPNVTGADGVVYVNKRVVNNYVLNSENLGAATWALTASTGSTVLTHNSATVLAPDGSATATRMVSTGVTGVNYHTHTLTVDWNVGDTIVVSAWLKSNTGANQTIVMRSATNISVVITPEWQRYSQTESATSASVSSFLIAVGAAFGFPTSSDISIWHPQVENVTGQTNQNAGEYISTGISSERKSQAFNYTNPNVTDGNKVVMQNAATTYWPTAGLIGYNTGAELFPSSLQSASIGVSSATVLSWNSFSVIAAYGFVYCPDAYLSNRVKGKVYKLTVSANVNVGKLVVTNAAGVIIMIKAGTCVFIADTGDAPVIKLDTAGAIATNIQISVKEVTSNIGYALYSSGLLCENTGINRLWYSNVFDVTLSAAVWVNVGLTVTANATTAPDGTLTASKLVETTANVQHMVIQSNTTLSAMYTASVFVKAAERSILIFQCGGPWTTFDLNTCEVGTIRNGTATAKIEVYANNWRRVILTTALGAAVNPTTINFCTGTLAAPVFTYAGTVGNGGYVWGAQLEDVTAATSYIPTTTGTGTRSATALVYPRINNLPLNDFTIYLELLPLDRVSFNTNLFGFKLNGSQYFALEYFTGSFHLESRNGSTAYDSAVPLSVLTNSFKIVIRKSSVTGVTLFVNELKGTPSLDIADITDVINATYFYIGTFATPSSACKIKNIKILNTPLTDTECLLLTA